MKLWSSKHEREHVESAADLFALIKAAEKLEKMYVRDLVTAKEYEPACLKLIAQFKTLCTSLGYNTHDVEQFMVRTGLFFCLLLACLIRCRNEEEIGRRLSCRGPRRL